MNLAKTIYQHSLNLPEAAAREALDFIEFLEQRYALVTVNTKHQNDTEDFLAAIAGGLSEDFPDDISDEDLGVDALREALD
jgi:molybdate-binding protein